MERKKAKKDNSNNSNKTAIHGFLSLIRRKHSEKQATPLNRLFLKNSKFKKKCMHVNATANH